PCKAGCARGPWCAPSRRSHCRCGPEPLWRYLAFDAPDHLRDTVKTNRDRLRAPKGLTQTRSRRSCAAAGQPLEWSQRAKGVETVAVTEEQVREALKQVIDPELGFDIVNLGLVYNIYIDGGTVWVDMTLTSPACMKIGRAHV